MRNGNSRPLKHLAFVIRTIGILNLLRHCLHLVDIVRYTDKVPPSDTVERVTCRAYLPVYCNSGANQRPPEPQSSLRSYLGSRVGCLRG